MGPTRLRPSATSAAAPKPFSTSWAATTRSRWPPTSSLPRGIVALLGLAGGTLPFGFFRLAPEASVTTVVAGTVRDLRGVVELARAGRIHSSLQTYPLEKINEALDDLRRGRVNGRAVVVPDGGGTR